MCFSICSHFDGEVATSLSTFLVLYIAPPGAQSGGGAPRAWPGPDGGARLPTEATRHCRKHTK